MPLVQGTRAQQAYGLTHQTETQETVLKGFMLMLTERSKIPFSVFAGCFCLVWANILLSFGPCAINESFLWGPRFENSCNPLMRDLGRAVAGRTDLGKKSIRQFDV
jgi:hypothetical protein